MLRIPWEDVTSVFLVAWLDWQVRADVTEGSEKLTEAIGDAEAVICATGFRYSGDIFAPWKVSASITWVYL